MSKKTKAAISIAGLIIIIVAAAVAYNALRDRMDPYDSIDLVAVPEPGQTPADGSGGMPAQGPGGTPAQGPGSGAGSGGSGNSNDPGPDNAKDPGTDNTKDPDNDDNKIIAPDFAMVDADGNSLKLSDLIATGSPIVLNFWASWCPPCKSEMPVFEKVFKELGDEVLFVMVDLVDGGRETIETGAKFIKSEGYTFPVYFDVHQEGGYAYGIRSIPTTLFIDREGCIVTGIQGAIDEKTLRRGIDLLW